jgi:hypothetical protein
LKRCTQITVHRMAELTRMANSRWSTPVHALQRSQADEEDVGEA